MALNEAETKVIQKALKHARLAADKKKKKKPRVRRASSQHVTTTCMFCLPGIDEAKNFPRLSAGAEINLTSL